MFHRLWQVGVSYLRNFSIDITRIPIICYTGRGLIYHSVGYKIPYPSNFLSLAYFLFAKDFD